MERGRKNEHRGLLIRGNFAPNQETIALNVLTKILGVFLGASLLISLIVYGITVHYETSINDVGEKTRSLTEVNKELLVHLNRIQSFKNVEAAAEQVPNLHLSEEVIDIPAKYPARLPEPPDRQGGSPRVPGL